MTLLNYWTIAIVHCCNVVLLSQMKLRTFCMVELNYETIELLDGDCVFLDYCTIYIMKYNCD